VLQLIRRHPQAAPRDEAVRRQVQAFRESVATVLKDRKKEASAPVSKVEDTSVAKFFEEIKVLVRDVPDRVASELGNDIRSIRGKRRHRFHPMMIEDMFHHPAFRESTIRASLFWWRLACFETISHGCMNLELSFTVLSKAEIHRESTVQVEALSIVSR
jgi:hypothetical protein